MHSPESKRDADLHELGFEPDQLEAFADLPVADLDLSVADLDLTVADLDLDAPEPRAEVPAAASAPTTAPGTVGKSVRISIRVPRGVLENYKARATGSAGYQTLMVRALREWLSLRGARTVR
jgi:uncharacterized protein (DUF4415 family)